MERRPTSPDQARSTPDELRPPVSLPVPLDVVRRIDEAELARLLGYPDRRIPPGRVADGVEEAGAWYREKARPWALARQIAIERIDDAEIELANGETLASTVLAKRMATAEATAVAVAAVSAGGEADRQSARLWDEDRPDEAYFLDRFAAAVVEHLAAWAGSHLRSGLDADGLGLLPSYSPGYHGWDLEQQGRVARCLTGGDATTNEAFEILDSGMIRPKSSLLAVFGITRRRDAAEAAWRRDACGWCSLTSCGFRRVRVSSSPL